MANVITAAQKKEINELYAEIGTYAGVARQMGISPTTVKRYVIPNYTPEKDVARVSCDIDKCRRIIELSHLTKEDFENKNILCLTDDEKKDIEELWKELCI